MITGRSYAAATLELSQPDNEDRKAKALAAATTELERLFRKKDFGRMKVVVESIRCLFSQIH
jgi:DNA mismatch repair protein PMS2